ncbi:hypothetical protein Ahy_B08g089675 [Arachis hypogaea]|uniref:Uncharacterized protein n=1 Tax=Arachis hypogaea TaxID=3818 RepID=A0A444XYJ6_ARAHY|nr:hypothetical protein Ahy_B08g089675 [Arachis hypogaea]
MTAEREENMYVLNNDCLPSRMDSKKRKKSQEDSDSESESTDDDIYEIGSEDLDELLMENNEKSATEGEKEADLRSIEGRYVSSETLSLVQESASEPTDSNIMVVREETPSEGLAIVPIQCPKQPLCRNLKKHLRQILNQPLCYKLKELQKQFWCILGYSSGVYLVTVWVYPAAEDAAALMMMARTTSYVPKTDPMPSFSLGLTDSSQEEAAMQEGASTQEADRAKTPETANLLEQLEDLVQKIASSVAKEESKSPQIQKEIGGESYGKFETPAGINQNTGDMKEKCYIWATRVKTYADGKTNEFDNVCTLIAQDKYILSRMHLASLEAGSYIEAEIVSAMCLILNQKNDKRFREQVYCLPPDIVVRDIFPQKVDYKKLSEDDKEIFRRFQGKTLKSLTDEMMDIGVGNEEDRLMFKRIFILYIQMAFLLPTTINKISPVHLAPIFEMDTITERNWGGHVLSFIIKPTTRRKRKGN